MQSEEVDPYENAVPCSGCDRLVDSSVNRRCPHPDCHKPLGDESGEDQVVIDGGRQPWWCKHCGHQLHADPWETGTCPECGEVRWVNRRYMVGQESVATDGGLVHQSGFEDEDDAQIARAMQAELGDAKQVYFKTTDIVARTDSNIREVAQRLRRVADALGYDLEKWGEGYNSSTWLLQRGGER